MQPIALRLLVALSFSERWLCTIAFIVLASLLFVDVLLRTVWGNGLVWSHQAGVYANIVVSLLGIGLASSTGSHLRPRFADKLLPKRWDGGVQRLQQWVTAVVFLMFALLSLQFVLESVALEERSTVLQTLVWPLQSLLPLVFGLGFIRHGLYGFFPELQPVSHEAAE